MRIGEHTRHRGALHPEKATLQECQMALDLLFTQSHGRPSFASKAAVEVAEDGNPVAPVCIRQARGAYDPQAFTFFLGGLAEHLPREAVQVRLDGREPQLHVRSVEDLAHAVNAMLHTHTPGRSGRAAEHIRNSLAGQTGRGRG